MRNGPIFYTTKKLIQRQVLKYDISEPGPYQKLWRGGEIDPEHAPENVSAKLRIKYKKQEEMPTPKKEH